jgi:hypothetical protein
MDLNRALDRMRQAGILVDVQEDRLVVRSRVPLTERQRAFLRTHKAALLPLLNSTQAAAPPPLTADEWQDIREAIAERAAIREHLGGESAADAEHEAHAAMRVYRYRLQDNPETWHTLVCPGCNQDQARTAIEHRGGPGSLAEFVPQPVGIGGHQIRDQNRDRGGIGHSDN